MCPHQLMPLTKKHGGETQYDYTCSRILRIGCNEGDNIFILILTSILISVLAKFKVQMVATNSYLGRKVISIKEVI